MQPFDHGADLVYHSATKFLSGPRHRDRRRAGRRRHASTGSGLRRDRPLRRADASPTTASTAWCSPRNRPSAPFLLRARREGLRDFGACMSPHTALPILQGIETLPLRMARHVENTRKVVEFLAAHPMVGVGRLSRARVASRPRAGAAAAAARLRRGVQLRPQGRPRGTAGASSRR